jgi:drug/metabolite transporter, DME family
LLETIHPNMLALIAAFLVAISRTLYQKALGRINPNVITALVNGVSVLFAVVFYQMGPGVEQWPIQGILWFVANGLVGSLFGRYMSFVSQRIVGVTRTSIVMQSILVWSTGLSVIFLGEHLTTGIIAGSLLIMVGGALLVWEGEKLQKKIPLTYYIVPLLTALTFALAFIVRRYGLAWIPSSPLGMGISTGTATFLMTGILCFTTEETGKRWNGGGISIAVVGGVFNAAAALCFWGAVQMGEIVQVVPINRLSVLFVIIFSWFFFRKEEAITWRVVTGGVLSVVGAYLIVIGK